MKDKKLKVFFDTSFFIRLFKSDDPDHAKARAYWSRFRKEGSELFLSTIVAAEFGVAGTIKQLPYKYITVLPFNLNHAERSSAMAQLAFENKRKGALQVASRVVIPNDTKILAQAEEVKADVFIARDDNCEKVFQLMKDNGLLSFEYLDLRTPPNQYFGELFEGV
jgi:predicted nucleic acid-binding protein